MKESGRRYELIELLGQGGMASVHVALSRGSFASAKLVAVKAIREELAARPDIVEMFLAEARLATMLNHPNVVQTYDVGEDEGRPFLAMEFLEGISYGSLWRDRSLPLGARVRTLIEVLAGLHYAHELTDLDGSPLPVIHRDVSPSNILVTWNGSVKVIDFGIASVRALAIGSVDGRLMGKLAYMSPEQARCEDLDGRTDVYSVGVLLWEALAQRRLWEGVEPKHIQGNLMMGDVPSLHSVRSDLPPRLVSICQKAMSYRREDRYPTAAAMADALEAATAGTELHLTVRAVSELIAQRFDARAQTAVRRRRARVAQLLDQGLDATTLFLVPDEVIQSPEASTAGTSGRSQTPAGLARDAGTAGPSETPAALSVEAPRRRAFSPASLALLLMLPLVVVASLAATRAWTLAATHPAAAATAPPAASPSLSPASPAAPPAPTEAPAPTPAATAPKEEASALPTAVTKPAVPPAPAVAPAIAPARNSTPAPARPRTVVPAAAPLPTLDVNNPYAVRGR